ncbi:MAG: hypothetical protein M1825_005310 [Sarcosagium campestre]|nr:MAG: hypothetical protein M1825_005310 [Sarcosagium campestre]
MLSPRPVGRCLNVSLLCPRRLRSRHLPCPSFNAHRNPYAGPSRRSAHTPADHDPLFTSIVDNPPQLIKAGRKHGPGLIILALIPLTAFGLGTWQVHRLDQKTQQIARFEDRLVRDPLPLPPHIDVSAIHEFDYRRVYASGRLRHDQEMLIGPRVHDGDDGYLVITPLDRSSDDSSRSDNGNVAGSVLVNRGWIPKRMRRQADRKEGALPTGRVTVEGLLREPWKKNMFTPENRPERGEYYFPDVVQMAAVAGTEPVWIEEVMSPDLIQAYDRASKGIPIGRAAEVNLRNNHTQYIFTWYGLALATSIMLWMVVRKPPADIARRVRQNKEWQ